MIFRGLADSLPYIMNRNLLLNGLDRSTRILVALSGGVDSAVAAARLVDEGFRVEAAYIRIWFTELDPFGECPAQRDIDDAQAVSEHLGIPFRVINLMDEYRELVVEYLLDEYRRGITPNPDVMCNRHIKFGVFRALAKREGFDKVATGHYARIRSSTDGGVDILTGCDPGKDQSYFLALLNQEQASDAVFPVGGLLKPDVRDCARRLGLKVADKKDSQGICFIGDVRMGDFLSSFLPDAPGPILDAEGRRLGTHRGLHHFTLGQRRGLGLASNTFRQNYVVVAKDKSRNTLIVAFDTPNSPGLYARACTLRDLGFIREPLNIAARIQARPRYRCPSQEANFTPLPGGRARLEFIKPQRALTPGQICALYNGDILLGGGVFETATPLQPV